MADKQTAADSKPKIVDPADAWYWAETVDALEMKSVLLPSQLHFKWIELGYNALSKQMDFFQTRLRADSKLLQTLGEAPSPTALPEISREYWQQALQDFKGSFAHENLAPTSAENTTSDTAQGPLSSGTQPLTTKTPAPSTKPEPTKQRTTKSPSPAKSRAASAKTSTSTATKVAAPRKRPARKATPVT
ncbi:hypothetical protein [Polycladidibacter hongkongensis]|uniref:hypothetical protein n=1 Tax=Polycladidibacter hongkongensis TaxID=1647556 RepID=UPI00082B4316|nr:hypothetical protein [Pseudovibrio hongkongensis]